MVPWSVPKIVYDDGGVVLSEHDRLQYACHTEPSINKHNVCICVVFGYTRVIWPGMHKFSVCWLSPTLQLPDVHVYGCETVLASQGLHPAFDFAKPFCRAVHGDDAHFGILGHDFRAASASEFQVFFGGWIGHHAGEELHVQLAGVHGHGLDITVVLFACQSIGPRHTPQEKENRSYACPLDSFRSCIHVFRPLLQDTTPPCVCFVRSFVSIQQVFSTPSFFSRSFCLFLDACVSFDAFRRAPADSTLTFQLFRGDVPGSSDWYVDLSFLSFRCVQVVFRSLRLLRIHFLPQWDPSGILLSLVSTCDCASCVPPR